MMSPDARRAVAVASRRLAHLYGPNANEEASRLLSRVRTLTSIETNQNNTLLNHYDVAINARLAGVPLEYALGFRAFCGRRIDVDERVFIPRDRTEGLVKRALELISIVPGRALDVGTGSGAIAISISLEAGALVYATDCSFDALRVAENNRRRLSAKVAFCQADLLQPFIKRSFGLIVANLPYTPSAIAEARLALPIHEPISALTPGPNGTSCYRKLVGQARSTLRPGGILLLQIDNGQALTLESFFAEPWQVQPRTSISRDDCVVEARLAS